MKHKLMIVIAIFFSPLACITAGYLSTREEEALARSGGYNNAVRTHAQEDIAHRDDINYAYFTSLQEDQEHRDNIDDAYYTRRAERLSQIYYN